MSDQMRDWTSGNPADADGQRKSQGRLDDIPDHNCQNSQRGDSSSVVEPDLMGPASEPHQLLTDGGTALAELFWTLPDPAIRYELQDEPRLRAVNSAYDETFNYDESEDEPLMDRLLSDVGEEARPAGEAASAATPDRRNVRTTIPNGSKRDYLLRTLPDDNDGGFVVLTDVTAQQEQVREIAAQRDRLDEFASIVSHDLRNPLDVAKIHLEAARENADDVHFDKIEDSHERMEQIIEDVLTLARHGRVIDETESVTLSTVARNAWNSVSSEEATIQFHGDTTLDADPDRLQELFENLFRNAIEHAGMDVTIEVGTSNGGFYVVDDGPGIPDEDREKVFEPDFSTREDGTGLGLVIVDRIAEAHGWSAGLGESETGARFEFEL